MDWDAFHQKGVAAVPRHREQPAGRLWVGVLYPNRSPTRPLEEFDFLWMTAHPRIRVKKVMDSVSVKFPDLDIQLEFKDEAVNPQTKLEALQHCSDFVVVLRATVKQSSVPLAAPAPPQTPTRQAHADPDHFSPALLMRSHQPRAGPTLSPSPANNGDGPAPSWDMLRDRERQLARLSNAGPLGATHVPATPAPPHDGDSARMDQMPVRREVTSPLSEAPHRLPSRALEDASNHAESHLTQNQIQHCQVLPNGTAPLAAGDPMTPDTGSKAEPHSSEPPQSQSQELATSFDPEEVFRRDPTPEADTESELRSTDHFIREIISQQTPEVLEAAVAKSMAIVESLKRTFRQYAGISLDARAWIESIEKLNSQVERARTVVGVVGNTGAGKSSVINAMLDEERLLPTNCMRACTAVVTELSWNDSTLPCSKYRAEIHFISPDEWERELAILLQEFLTEEGQVSRDASNADTDAGIAYAKCRAVYPHIHKDMWKNYNSTKLMAEKRVSAVLGTTKRIDSAYPGKFYTELQKYVDSKEKATGKKDKDKKPSAHQMEYWPLIKVVKIYTKASALSTGAVVVDLPGVHDSNVARAAVADRYMKQCTGLWIVAPINRAVDDKAAKTLLGDSFKRQLKYDGGYSSVTFICSKTDDISITEATESLGLGDQISALEDQEFAYEEQIKNTKDKLCELRESLEVYRIALNDASEDVEKWDILKERVEDGETVFAPEPKASNKRKKGVSGKTSRKRHQFENDDSEVEYISSDNEEEGDSDNDSETDGIQAPQEPLSEDAIKAKLDELRDTKKNARQEKKKIEDEMKELKPKIRELKDKKDEIQGQISAICIAGRNEYSKGAIQQDFAQGIRELDQENAAEEDEENFNPDEDLRDYDEVARSLPVFCVSSRAYQKMCGRLKKDQDVPGFTTPEETEMPQLKAHCKRLTEAVRIQNCRTFLLGFCQQLNTFSLWASNDGMGLKMTDEEKRRQVNWLQKRLGVLEKGLMGVVGECLKVMKTELSNQIFNKYPELIDEAIQAAPDTSDRWGSHRNNGGLYFGTYRAIVRREGSYTSATAGHRDFNAELLEPILKKLATGWERAFQNRLPKAFEAYTRDSGKVLHKFHELVENRARETGVGLANLAILKNSICTYEQLFRDLKEQLVTDMTEHQREANRDFVPTIASAMLTAYEMCASEYGKGCYMRMKGHMRTHVDHSRHTMFKEATDTVEKHLEQMCHDLDEEMANKVDEIFGKMRVDYMRVLGGVQVSPDVMSREERAMRAEVKALLNEVDPQFERIAAGELDEGPDDEAAGKQGDEAEDESLNVNGSEEPEERVQVEDDAESVPDSAQGNVDDTMYDDANDDTHITEPSLRANSVGMEEADTGDKDAALPTPTSERDEMLLDELYD